MLIHWGCAHCYGTTHIMIVRFKGATQIMIVKKKKLGANRANILIHVVTFLSYSDFF